jgi:hypothetical protein
MTRADILLCIAEVRELRQCLLSGAKRKTYARIELFRF